MSTPRFKSIEDYLESVDPVKAKTIRTVLDFILAEFPELASKISWNVPTIHRDGKYVAGICAYNNHLTFAPWSPQIIANNKKKLEKKFVVKMNCFQLPVDWRLDRKLIKELVKARLAELDVA